MVGAVCPALPCLCHRVGRGSLTVSKAHPKPARDALGGCTFAFRVPRARMPWGGCGQRKGLFVVFFLS